MPRLVLASVLFAALATDVFQGPRRVSGGAPAVLPPHAAGGGEVFLEVKVSASGAVAEIKTVRDGPPFTDALRDALKGWRFEPAKQAGAAVASAVLVAGVFRPPVLVGGAPAGSPPVSGRPDCDEIPVPAEAVTPPYPTQGQGDHVVLAEVMVERDGGVARVSVVKGPGSSHARLPTPPDAGVSGLPATRGKPSRHGPTSSSASRPLRSCRPSSADRSRLRVHSDEQALGRVTGEDAGQPAVAGADVDGDPAREAGDEISESVIGALEALAADDVHRSVFYGRSLSASSRVYVWRACS